MDLRRLLKIQREFVRAREWDQFHTPKNLAAALSVEASELLEIFQWMSREQEAALREDRVTMNRIEQEVADVFFFLLRICDVLGVDIQDAFKKKMRQNARKYPVRQARGNSIKYTELKKTRPSRRRSK